MANIADIIKYEGGNNIFIWKHPCEDFNTATQLIVHESQEAIFFMNGQALDLFGPGRYTLETENIPLIRKLTSIPTDGKTPFHCEVYFINKTEQMGLRWGTDSRIQYIEPTYNFPISIGANGEMSLSVANSRKLLVKIVGTERILTRELLTSFFRGLLMTKVKTYIAQEIKTSMINIFEIDGKLEEISKTIKEKLEPDFLEYGISLNRFYITTILKPDGDEQYEKFKDLHFRKYADIVEAELKQKVDLINEETKVKQMVIESEGLAKKRATEGYTYQQERGFDIAKTVAGNEGTGANFANMGIGLGMMAGMSNSIGNTVNESVNNAFRNMDLKENTNNFCEKCGNVLSGNVLFCDDCGQKINKSNKCLNCGYIFTKPGNFCPKCGQKRGA